MYNALKEKVLKANLQLPEYGLVTFTWGNVSEIDRVNNVIAIKPSGVEYDVMQTSDIVIVDLDGNVIEGKKYYTNGHLGGGDPEAEEEEKCCGGEGNEEFRGVENKYA